MKIQHFYTKDKCITSINLTPYHYKYLMNLTESKFNGDLSMTIDYLLKKYLIYLYRISLTPSKRTLTATYQPRAKNYMIKKIRIQPTYWGMFFELRLLLGYSISFMIRIMLDWEMQEEQIPIIPIIIKPNLTIEDEQTLSLIQYGNNYLSYNRVSHANLEVYNEFLCLTM